MWELPEEVREGKGDLLGWLEGERVHRIYQNRLFLSLFRERDFQWLPEEFCV